MRKFILSLAILASTALSADAQYYYDNSSNNDYDYQEQQRLEGQQRLNDAIDGANSAASQASGYSCESRGGYNCYNR